jgi:DNA-binding response OmpR family regulator
MTAVHDLRHDDLSLIVVDDARTGRIYFMRALEQAGYDDLRVAESAHRALELMAERPADVIIADWLMPGMDGLELTQRVRERDEDQSRYTAVILSTAREGVSALVTAFRSGVDDFLHKPFDAEELIARIFAAGSQANARNMLLETTQTLADKRAARVENWATDAMTGLGGADYFEAQLTTHLMEIAMRRRGLRGPGRRQRSCRRRRRPDDGAHARRATHRAPRAPDRCRLPHRRPALRDCHVRSGCERLPGGDVRSHRTRGRRAAHRPPGRTHRYRRRPRLRLLGRARHRPVAGGTAKPRRTPTTRPRGDSLRAPV